MHAGDRIKRRRTQLGMSVDRLAELIGKNRATIYRYESNEIEKMPVEIIKPLAKALNVSPAYLMGWEEVSYKDLSTEYTYIPISISAGQPLFVDSVKEGDTDKIKIPDSLMGKYAGHSDIFMMKVNGDSMNKTMPDGSLIAVKQTEINNIKDGDIVVYSCDGDYSVKRFYRSDGKIIFRPHSTDLGFTDHVIDSSMYNVTIHGKVVIYIVELD